MSADALRTVTSNVVMINHLLTKLADTPEKRNAFLKGISVAPKNLSNRKPCVNAYEEIVFMSNISRLQGDDWVWRNTQLWEPQALGALGRAILSAPNCGEALKVITQFGYLWGPNLFFEHFYETVDGRVKQVLTLDLIFADYDNYKGLKCQRDIVMLSLYKMLDQLLDKSWYGAEIHFSGEIDVPADIYKNVFRCPVKIGQARHGFSIPAALCERESPNSDKIMFQRAVLALHQLSGAPAQDDAFKQRVITYLSSVTTGRASATEVALSLGVSLRTLNRRLRDNGTTFRELLEASLKRRANAMLTAKMLSRAQISDRLGFNDQASFSRALKRWRQSRQAP